MTWPNGDEYVGTLRDGLHQGRGRFKWSNGDMYSGEWDMGRQHGVGEMQSWVRGMLLMKAMGEGVYAYKLRYNGQWKKNLMHGHGVLEYFDRPAEGREGGVHGRVLRRFEGFFEEGFARVGTLKTPQETFKKVQFDGATPVGDFATWYWGAEDCKPGGGSRLVDIGIAGEEARAVLQRFETSMASVGCAGCRIKIERIEHQDGRIIHDLQKRAIKNRVCKPPRSRKWNPRTMEHWAFHAPVHYLSGSFTNHCPRATAFRISVLRAFAMSSGLEASAQPYACRSLFQRGLEECGVAPPSVTAVCICALQGGGNASNGNPRSAERPALPFESIVQEGYKPGLAGSKNGYVFGFGTYFARKFELAHKYALQSAGLPQGWRPALATGSPQGAKDAIPLRVFLSRIITGVYTGACTSSTLHALRCQQRPNIHLNASLPVHRSRADLH